MSQTILITGASGHLGGGVLDHLLTLVPAERLIAFARDPQKVARFAAKGVTVRQGDLGDPASLDRAFAGVHTLLLVPTVSVGPVRDAENRNAVDAAKRAGVQHILYAGVIHHGETGHGAIVNDHQNVERYIAASGIAHTFIRNGLYLDVLPMLLGNAHETGTFHYPNTKGLTVGLRADLAEATARIIADPALQGGVKELGLPVTTTFPAVAATLSKVIGKPVSHVDIPLSDLKAGMLGAGVPEPMADIYTDMGRAIAEGMIHARVDTLRDILGREPVDVEHFLQGAYAAQPQTV